MLVNAYTNPKKTTRLTSNYTSFLQDKGIDFTVQETIVNATKTVKDCLDDSCSDLVIVGGDGTINEVVNGIPIPIPISIIPGGTGNDFVKNVSLGKTDQEVFQTATYGRVAAIDLGKCNDRYFVNGVGIGFDGQIVEDMIAKRVPILRGHAAYYYHVLRILGSYRERPFNFSIDGEKHVNDLILLTVGNGTTFGGGFKLMPRAKIDDGLLEGCEIGKVSPFRRFVNIHRLSKGTHGVLKEVEFYQCKKITIEKNLMLFAHMDGERLGQPPFEISIAPKKLLLRVKT